MAEAVAEALTDHGAVLAETAVDRAREIAPVIEAAHEAIDVGRELTPEVLDAMHGAELWRMALPKSLGGAELAPPILAQMTEIVAKADASAGWCLGQGTGCAMSAAFLDDGPASEVFGPANAVLAWGAGTAGKAIASEGGYNVTGTWKFASGSKHATWIGGHCKVFESDGSPRLHSDGRQVDRTALFRRATVEMHDDWYVMGLKGTRSEGYTVVDRFVDEGFTLDRDTYTQCRNPAPLYRFPTTLVYAGCFSGVALGIARGALDDLIELAAIKTQRSARSSMRESPVFHTQIGELEAQFAAARSYQQSTLNEVWDVVHETCDLSVENRARIRLACTYAINQATDIVHSVYRLAGSTAIFENAPFERRFRDMNAVGQQMQARQTHYETVGRLVMGLDSTTPHM